MIIFMSCGSSGNVLVYGLDGPGLIPVLEGWRFSLVLNTQTGAGIHFVYYKMSTADKGGRGRTSPPTFSYCHGCVYIGMCTRASTSPVGLHGL